MPSISRIETWTGRRAFLPVAAAGLLLSLASGSAAPAPSPSPAGPPAADALPDPAARAEVELNAFTLAPGWRIELVAADALVGSPLGLQFSPDGRLWVLEAGGGPPAGEAEAGRGGGLIAVLEDADGDGRMDRRTLFATGLKAPRGLVLLGNGALVLDGTEFWFLRDRDGDAVADERSKVAADPDDVRDRRAGSRRLVWSIDNWIYAADSTTRLRYYGSGGFARDFTDRRPGRSVATDEVGRLYYSGDARFLHADRIPSGYRWRNPGAGAGDERWGLPVEPALNGAAAPLADLLIYRGATLGAGWDGVVLVAESGRLVGCRLPSGGGRPGPAGPGETGIVLVTAPSQVRLAGMAQGFDGALYVAGQVDGGAASGRIWRLRPAIVTGRAGKFSGSVPLAELVNDLAHADGWRRDTAQRLIIEREDPGAARLVREFALGATSPIGRVHALWTLEGLEAVDRETVLRLLDDADPRVCSTAVRQAEKFL